MRKVPPTCRPVGVLLGVLLVGGAGRSEADRYPWGRPPGNIAGRWRMTCEMRGPMAVEVTRQGDRKAIGRLVELGGGARFGYKLDEEVLRVEANDFGAWVGQQLWR